MATLRQRKDSGAYEILFQDEYRRKRTITLSGKKFTKDFADDLKKTVEVLIHEKLYGLQTTEVFCVFRRPVIS